MIIVRTPHDDLFNYSECEEMYNKNKELIGDDDFKDIVKRTFFYSFYEWNTHKFIGCIYYYYRNDGRLFFNGFAGRKHHLLNLECVKKTLNWFDCDIYAETKHKTAKLCLLKCGFEKFENDIYIYRRKK